MNDFGRPNRGGWMDAASMSSMGGNLSNYGYGEERDRGLRGGRDRENRDSAPSNDSQDNPPHSRLFIIGGRSLEEEDFHTAFGEFGTVERVEMKKGKGITYVKFSKTSEAADALEELNGKSIGEDPRPLKIVIATAKNQGNSKEDVNALRLFVIIPKSYDEDDLRKKFSSYGPIEYVNIIKDKRTQESKGLGYVKYFRFSHAARAFEGEEDFKPKFAEPRPAGHRERDNDRGSERGSFGGSSYGPGSGFGGGYGGGSNFGDSDPIPNNIRPAFESTVPNPSGTCRLAFMCNTILTQEKLWKLFDIVPGLETVELLNTEPGTDRGYGNVIYNNPNSAAYAIEKLCGFDYPLGSRLMIKFDESVPGRRGGGVGAFVQGPGGAALPSDIKTLVNTIQHATEMLQKSGYGDTVSVARGETPAMFEPSMCTVSLPPSQPLVRDGECVERLFVVFKECRDNSPPQNILNDVFGRFGNLLEVYVLKGKRCGYAKYCNKESAKQAMEALNHQTLCGTFLKVMIAEQSYSEKAKRAKLDNDTDF